MSDRLNIAQHQSIFDPVSISKAAKHRITPSSIAGTRAPPRRPRYISRARRGRESTNSRAVLSSFPTVDNLVSLTLDDRYTTRMLSGDERSAAR